MIMAKTAITFIAENTRVKIIEFALSVTFRSRVRLWDRPYDIYNMTDKIFTQKIAAREHNELMLW